jgi:hypothetical protein
VLESSWNVMAHGEAWEGKWRGNWRMEWVASTVHTTLEHGVSSITTADAHISAAGSLLNWRLRRFKWTRPFRRKTKSGFCACAITFQTQSTTVPSYEAVLTQHYRMMHCVIPIEKSTDSEWSERVRDRWGRYVVPRPVTEYQSTLRIIPEEWGSQSDQVCKTQHFLQITRSTNFPLWSLLGRARLSFLWHRLDKNWSTGESKRTRGCGQRWSRSLSPSASPPVILLAVSWIRAIQRRLSISARTEGKHGNLGRVRRPQHLRKSTDA